MRLALYVEPLATQEEAAACKTKIALEAAQELEFQRHITGEVEVGTWTSAVDQAGDCVTLHPVFQDVCLNRWVLEVASLTL